jgi:hypothetical protein
MRRHPLNVADIALHNLRRQFNPSRRDLAKGRGHQSALASHRLCQVVDHSDELADLCRIRRFRIDSDSRVDNISHAMVTYFWGGRFVGAARPFVFSDQCCVVVRAASQRSTSSRS